MKRLVKEGGKGELERKGTNREKRREKSQQLEEERKVGILGRQEMKVRIAMTRELRKRPKWENAGMSDTSKRKKMNEVKVK